MVFFWTPLAKEGMRLEDKSSQVGPRSEGLITYELDTVPTKPDCKVLEMQKIFKNLCRYFKKIILNWK